MQDSKERRSKPITKMALYLRALRVSLWIVVPFFVFILLMALSGDANIQPGLQNTLLFVGGTTIAFCAFLLIVLSPSILQDLHRIKVQEKQYGFNFNEEMKKLGVMQFVYVDDDWLILVNRLRVYAYKKGFLTDFGFQRKSMLGKKMEAKIIASCADGKARIIAGSSATLTAIQDWAIEDSPPE